MIRPKYKQLYNQTTALLNAEQNKRVYVENELARLKGILAEHGEKLLGQIGPGDGMTPIFLNDLEYEMAKASVARMMRMPLSGDVDNGFTTLTWKGRQVWRL
jgi:hypothetical protein